MRLILLPFGLLVIAIVGVAMLQSGLITGGDDVTVSDEAWTPQTGTFVDLNDSRQANTYYENSTIVYNTTNNNDTLQEQGTDYIWNETDGTIQAVAGEGLDGATDANITYAYQETTAEEERIAQLLVQLPRIVGVILPFLAIVFFVMVMRGG